MAEADSPDALEAPLDDLRERLNISLLAAGVAGSWDWDIRNDRLYFDYRMATLYGLDPAEAERGLPTSAFFKCIYPGDANRLRIAVAGMLNGAELFLKSYRIIAADGLVRWVEAHGRCHFGTDEQPERFSGILVDVTDRRRMQATLLSAERMVAVGTIAASVAHERPALPTRSDPSSRTASSKARSTRSASSAGSRRSRTRTSSTSCSAATRRSAS